MLNMTMEILGLTIRGMMMVTNEERREVARKLRNSDIERHQLNPMVSHATVTICGSSIVCIDEESLRMALDYLADLIEPEPERKSKI